MSLDGGNSEPPRGIPAFQHLLFVWLSPSFPVGAFAYSHGLEQAVERGYLKSRADLQDWLDGLIEKGSLRNDLLLLAAAYRAAASGNIAALQLANSLALALQPSAERYLETTQQGGSFLIAIAAAWPNTAFAELHPALAGETAYPVSVALAAATHDIPLSPALEAYAFAFATNLTSAAIRLGIIGQTDAQLVIAGLSPKLYVATALAESGTIEEIGGATFSADLCSLEHETQYSRLFRS